MSPALTLALGSETIGFRPSYAALVAAEAELGSLFALVDRASTGNMRMGEMIALIWHCRMDADLNRDDFGARCVTAGLAAITPLFRSLVEQALGGQ